MKREPATLSAHHQAKLWAAAIEARRVGEITGPGIIECESDPLGEFQAELIRAAYDQGRVKRLAEVDLDDEFRLDIKVDGRYRPFYLLSNREREICEMLADEIGEGYGVDPDYLTDPQRYVDEFPNLCAQIREYVMSGHAKNEFHEYHIEGFFDEPILILRDRVGMGSHCFDSCSAEQPDYWWSFNFTTGKDVLSPVKPLEHEGWIHMALYQ